MKHLLLSISFLNLFFFSHAQSPRLWATASAGGLNGYGAILESDISGNNFHVVYLFDDVNGSGPLGNLCEGGNGKLYGVTEFGGFNDSCVVFSFDTTTGICDNFHDLDMNHDSGVGAVSGMIRASDGMLYGMTSSGGNSGYGVIYRVDPALDSYSPIFHFNQLTGQFPNGTLVQLNDGKLYGMTYSGGSNGVGVIFSFDPSDSFYVDLYDFDTSTGANPQYGNLLVADDGKLYGMTNIGGASLEGVVFSFDPLNGNYADLHDFNGTDGEYPDGSIIQADNGMLYGMAGGGGLYQSGVIFKYDINSQNYSVVYNFESSTGAVPPRSLMQASNGKLYGTTLYGGASNYGVAFSFDILNNTYTKLIDIYQLGCGSPNCDILETGAQPTGILIPSSAQSISLYPDPAKDKITIAGNMLHAQSKVTITDVHGKSVYDFTIKGNDIDVSRLSHGVYVISIRSDDVVGEGKFLKE